MSTPQDLFAALKLLDQGVTQFATTRAVNDANEKVRSLRESQIDEAQKLQGFRDVANSLTQRLATMGMDNASIENATAGIAPPKAPLIQSPFQGMLADLDLQTTGGKQEAVKRSNAYIDKTNEMKQLGALQKNAKKEKDDLIKAGDDAIKGFPKVPIAKAALEAYTAARLSPAEFADQNNIALTMSVKSLIKASGDSKPSDKDMAQMVPDKTIWSAVKRAYSEYLAGRPLPSDAKTLEYTVKLLQTKSQALAQKAVKGYSSQHARRHGLDPAQLEQDLLMTHMPDLTLRDGGAEQPTQQQGAPAASGWQSFVE